MHIYPLGLQLPSQATKPIPVMTPITTATPRIDIPVARITVFRLACPEPESESALEFETGRDQLLGVGSDADPESPGI